MTDNDSSNKQPGGSPLNKQTIGVMILSAAAAPLVKAALEHAEKVPQVIAARRKKPKLRNEAIYRHVYKVRVIGETALALDNEGSNDERRQIVADSAALRDALHDQLADLRLSSAAQKSDVLDAAQTAIRDTDRLVATLNRWALNSSDASQVSALQQAVRALEASENALLSCMGKNRRWRPRKGEDSRTSDGEPIP